MLLGGGPIAGDGNDIPLHGGRLLPEAFDCFRNRSCLRVDPVQRHAADIRRESVPRRIMRAEIAAVDYGRWRPAGPRQVQRDF